MVYSEVLFSSASPSPSFIALLYTPVYGSQRTAEGLCSDKQRSL
jgi:hypothetical protein